MSERLHSGVVVLSVNAGSSSVKTALFSVTPSDGPRRLAAVAASGIGEDDAMLSWQIDGRRHADRRERIDDHHHAIGAIMDALHDADLPVPHAVGHRIVRSPRGRAAPARLDEGLRAALEDCRTLAPLHIPTELESVDAAREHFPGAEQIVCFDNHFFSRLPAVARRLPLPRDLDEAGFEKIGYHGLSYEYIVHRLGNLHGRTVIAHLGNGASMAALRDAEPVDTTMGYTPTGGLMMGTRTGDLDPGVLVALMRQRGLDADGLERLVNHRGGLAGVSGGESSMRALLQRATDDHPANQAVDLFCYTARKHLGGMIAALGGADTIVFTGGIGENSPEVRARILDDLDDLGIVLDGPANRAGMPDIASRYSRVRIRVIPTDEDWVIARHAADLLTEEQYA